MVGLKEWLEGTASGLKQDWESSQVEGGFEEGDALEWYEDEEMMRQMGGCQQGRGEECGDEAAMAMVLDLVKAFERVSRTVVWPWATHFNFTRQLLRLLCGYP